MADEKRPQPLIIKIEPTSPAARDWVIKNVIVGNTVTGTGEHAVPAATTYHSPCLARTLLGGPGNRSRIMSCSCGARFAGDYAYVGLEGRLSDWYARHAGIAGGGEAVAKILRAYDQARDVIDYPDHPKMHGKTARDPEEILRELRTE